MTNKPEVQGWRITRMSGNGYGKKRRIVDADIYNAEDPAFWAAGAMERYSIEPLIRLTDHEASRAADKARIAELEEALDKLANGYAGNGWDVGLMPRLEKARAILKKEPAQ